MAQRPGPWRITFDTNPDDCNLRCLMCECFSPHSSVQKKRIQQGAAKRRMSIQLIRHIIEQAKGTPLREIIPSTMGEPLLYKHFEEIIQLCHEFNLKLNLTTNGTFPGKGAEGWSKILVPVTSDVKFSWNGATKQTQEQIMLGTKWEKVLANLATFIQIRDKHAAQGGNRCRVTLQLTFLEENVKELAKIVELGIELGVDRIKGHHLWAHFKEIENQSMRRNPEAIERWNQSVTAAYHVAKHKRLANGQTIQLENMTYLGNEAVRDLDPEAVCPFLDQEAWVNPEGKFSPCCAPDQQRQTLGDFGNLHDQSLEQIWQSQAYRTLQRGYKNHPLCVGCNMRKPLVKDEPSCNTLS